MNAAEKTAPHEKTENPILKLVLEVGPLGAFFLAYGQSERIGAMAGYPDAKPIFVATAVFMAVMSIAVAASWLISRKVAVMPLVSLALVLVFGTLTLVLKDALFIKMKPTILNLLFATVLLGGLYYGKMFLKTIFQDGWSITDQGWRVLTIRWAIFFIFMAILNEVIWRNFTEETWVAFKVWGNLPLTMVFAIFQMRVVLQHEIPQTESD